MNSTISSGGTQDKQIDDFVRVYNEAWASFKIHFEPLDAEYISGVLSKARAFIDEEFIWLAYFEGKPIAVFLMYPDLNQILKHLDGKLNLLNMIRILWLKKRKTMTRLKVLLMGVIPKYQGLGIESAFIVNLLKVLRKRTITGKPSFPGLQISIRE